MTEMFVEHFTDIPKKLKNKLKRGNNHYLDYLNKIPVCQNYLILIEDIYNILNNLQNYSSPGSLNVPNYFLKKISHKLALPLTDEVNRSLEFGYVTHILIK